MRTDKLLYLPRPACGGREDEEAWVRIGYT